MTHDDYIDPQMDTYVEQQTVKRHVAKMLANDEPGAVEAAIGYLREYASPDLVKEIALAALGDDPASQPTEPALTPGDLGGVVGDTQAALLKLGRQMRLEAAQGLRKPSEARAVHTEFNVTASVASGKHNRPTQPNKVQVSKLKRFLDAGAAHGLAAVDLVDLASKVYVTHFMLNPDLKGKELEKGEYNSVVRVLRRAIWWERIPSEHEVFQLIKGDLD